MRGLLYKPGEKGVVEEIPDGKQEYKDIQKQQDINGLHAFILRL